MAFNWNPTPIFFKIPFIGISLRWYSLFFALGFFGGAFFFFFLIRHYITSFLPVNSSFLSKQAKKRLQYLLNGDDLKNNLDLKKEITSLDPSQRSRVTSFLSAEITQLIMVYLMVGILVGARLGEVIFYSGTDFLYKPWEIFMTWKGGLSSHGGLAGVIISSILFRRRIRSSFPDLTLFKLLNYLSPPSAFCAVWIRVGNFFNQEVLGYPTSAPWGVYFGSPFDGSLPQVRHPVQIYEALVYAFVFIQLSYLAFYKRSVKALFSILLIEIFAARFFIEFLKQPQENFQPFLGVKMGQWLSIPCILAGIYFLRTLNNTQKNIT